MSQFLLVTITEVSAAYTLAAKETTMTIEQDIPHNRENTQ